MKQATDRPRPCDKGPNVGGGAVRAPCRRNLIRPHMSVLNEAIHPATRSDKHHIHRHTTRTATNLPNPDTDTHLTHA